MFNRVMKKVFGSRNERLIKRMQKTVDQINELEPDIAALSDADLQAKTGEFRRASGAGRIIKGRSRRCAPERARPWWPPWRPI